VKLIQRVSRMSFLLGQRSFQLTFSRFVLFRFFTLRNFFVTMTLFVCLHHESSTNRMIHKNGCLSDRSLFMACVVYVGFYDRLPTITNCPGVSGYFTRWLWGSPWSTQYLWTVATPERTLRLKPNTTFQRQLTWVRWLNSETKSFWSSGGKSILCSWFVRTTDLYEIWIKTSDNLIETRDIVRK